MEMVPGETRGGRCVIIGEVAQSHDGSLGLAHAYIDAIADAGADAVKFQTHIAAEESTPAEPWRIVFSKQDATRYEYWKRMEFTENQWIGLKTHADDRGLLFLSTPFSIRAADMLVRIGLSVWKIASGEIGNTVLLNHVVHTGRPVILSSGMSALDELDAAVQIVKDFGNPLAVLQCTSSYPCPPEKVGLNMLQVLRGRYNCPTGLSDHTGNIYAGLAAVTLGAEVLEVHVTFSRQMFGPDVASSITFDELGSLVRGTRQIEMMNMNPVDKDQMADEMAPIRKLFTKSVVASTDLPAGTVIRPEHLQLKKPGTGLSASSLPTLIGRRLIRNVNADEMMGLQDFEEIA